VNQWRAVVVKRPKPTMEIATAALAIGEASPYCRMKGEAVRAVSVFKRLTCCMKDKEGRRQNHCRFQFRSLLL
jgi:hypothetical protein